MNCVYVRFGIFLFFSLQLGAMNNGQNQPQSLAAAALIASSAGEAPGATRRYHVGDITRRAEAEIFMRLLNFNRRPEAIALVPPVTIARQSAVSFSSSSGNESLNAIMPNAVIPALSGTDEEIHARLQQVRNENGILENQQPVNQQFADDEVCVMCGNEFKNLEVHNSVRVTNCCHRLICQRDVDQIDKIAYNLFIRSKNRAFLFGDEVKPLGVCPFCQHYPFSTSPNS